MRRLVPLLLFALAGCSGSDDGYDAAVRIPPRTDPVVVHLPPTDPTRFHEIGKLDDYLRSLGTALDPAELPPEQRAELTRVLEDLFGTPSAPRVPNDGPAGALALSAANLAAGSKLYKRLCVQCHGLAGDGRGPNGLFVTNPVPRDFRRGRAKYVSAPGGTPTIADVKRFVARGAGSSVMPGFPLLSESESDDMARYVAYLTFRGRVEFDLLSELLGPDGLDDPLPQAARSRLAAEVNRWQIAEATVVDIPPEPEATPERIREGFRLYATTCATCHVDYGRTPTFKHDLCGVPTRVTDLTADGYRGGKEPADLFRRVKHGIPLSQMPAATLPDDQVWAMVAFLRALPTPRMLPDDVRKTVYPGAE